MKKLMAVTFLALFAIACGNPVTGPSDATPTYPSAHGTLPDWLFFEGHLPFIPSGMHELYFGAGVGDDPAVAAAIEQSWIGSANTMTKGRVRFVRSSRADAPFSIAIAPDKIQNPTALGQNALTIEKPTYLIRSGHISLRSREYALNNVSLHEIGHSLFGPGHSGREGDIMGIRNYSQPAFSGLEEAEWHQMREVGAGATSMSASDRGSDTITIVVN